jgi:hypothetical protein
MVDHVAVRGSGRGGTDGGPGIVGGSDLPALGSVSGVSGLAVVQVLASSSRGDSGIGPVLIAVGLTVASALVLSWLIGRLPGSNENTGAGVFSRRRRRDPFEQPPDDADPPPRGPFDR